MIPNVFPGQCLTFSFLPISLILIGKKVCSPLLIVQENHSSLSDSLRFFWGLHILSELS